MCSLPHNRWSWLIFRKALFAGCAGAAVLALSPVFDPASLHAQTLNDRLAARQGKNTSRMLVDAREVVYDRDNDRVSAVGDVQVYYQGRVLEADRVTYDRKNKRVFAEGNARLTEADGTKTHGTRFDLTDDFRDGFIDSLRTETDTKTRFSAARAERIGGESTVLDRGTFTACEPCRENPEKPPLWQVKAARIIHNNTEQRVYYENATLEFWGVPVAWFPFFSTPDPTVTRLSGVLAPRILSRTRLGTGIGIPYYWAIAQNYDLTVTPTYLSKQGFHGDVLWRHRLENGSYSVRLNGIDQQDRHAFPTLPSEGGGAKAFRGSIETRGLFYLNEKWTFGWNGSIATDKFYFRDYKTKPQTINQLFTQDSVSEIYLRGRGERSWFDLSAYHFLGLGTADWQKQIETATPSFDFDRRFTPDALGGEVKVSLNSALIRRDAAVYQPLALDGAETYIPGGLLYRGNSDGTYLPCTYDRGGAIVGGYTPGKCLLRGFAGDYARASLDTQWRRRFIDPAGQEWTPFVGVRADASYLNVNLSSFNAPQDAYGYGNDKQANFLGGNADNFILRGMPMLGIDYRYPLIAITDFGTHHVEPLAQVIIRPNENRIGKLPNEDAQSLIFDENSLFSYNKFSGYDRIEGGSRLNYGARYSFQSRNDMFATVLFGQSVQLFGKNSFAAYDLANTGRESGLETRRSDFIAATTLQPISAASLTVRGRFDDETLDLKRIDVDARASYGRVSFSGLYSRIAPQPDLGYPLRREGVQLASTVQLPRNFYVSGAVLFDLDRYLTDRANVAVNGGLYNNTPWRVAATSLGFGYKDECTDLALLYSRSIADATSISQGTTTTYMVRLMLKDLGDVQYSKRDTK